MSTQHTHDRVKELIGRELIADETEMTSLNKDFGTLMIFREFLEMEFKIEIEPSDLSNCETVADVVTLVEKVQEKFPGISHISNSGHDAAKAEEEPAIPSLYDRLWWGIERHELVAAAAEEQLTPTALARVQQILAPVNQDSLEQIAGWADRIKGGNDIGDNDTLEFRALFPVAVHQTWHYVNVPAEATGYSRTTYPQFTRNDDVVQMIATAILVLQDKSSFMSSLNALRWLTHLVGDVHQPVHVGCSYIDDKDGRLQLAFDPTHILEKNLTHDQGGNRLILPIGSKVTLHSYWDSMIPGSISPLFARTEIKQQRVKQLIDGGSYEAANLAAPAATDIHLWAEQWATESVINSRMAYQSLKITGKSGTKFKVSWEGKGSYDARCEPIVSGQLKLAAARLASVLNELFG